MWGSTSHPEIKSTCSTNWASRGPKKTHLNGCYFTALALPNPRRITIREYEWNNQSCWSLCHWHYGAQWILNFAPKWHFTKKKKVSLYILFILAVSTFWLEWLLIINYWLGRIYICHFCFLSFLFLFSVYLLFLFLSSSTSSFFCVKLDIFLVYHFNPVVFYYIFKGIFVVVILDSIVNI